MSFEINETQAKIVFISLSKFQNINLTIKNYNNCLNVHKLF